MAGSMEHPQVMRLHDPMDGCYGMGRVGVLCVACVFG